MKIITLLIALPLLFIIPFTGNSQTVKQKSPEKDTLNIGFVIYTKSNTPGTLDALWNYANRYSGKGKATGISKEGFAGNYHIKYYYENGKFSDEYDLAIEKTGKFYNLSWLTNGKLSARDVGTVIDNRLMAGWRRVTDNENSEATQKDTTKLNIDGLKASPANFKLLLENKYVRMLEYTLKPGEKDMPHTHPAKSSYIVSGGKIKVYLENGETLIFDEKAGTADWGDYVGKHSVENIGNTTVIIVLTEIKSLEK